MTVLQQPFVFLRLLGSDIMADISTTTVGVADLRDLLAEASELAVLDVRELGVHIEAGHILLSAPLPLSLLELRIASLVVPVPGRATIAETDCIS